MREKPLVIAILAKSVEHILPTYLNSLMAQTALSSDTIFYIRTNDNRDGTAEILRDWYKKWNWKWKMVFDDSSVNPSLIEQDNHDWSYDRFKILGKLRQESIEFAKSEGADYFIADTDNIVLPKTIKSLRETGMPVVSPLLHAVDPTSMYGNFHSSVDDNGYFKSDDFYNYIHYQWYKGLIQVPVVHCTYFIRNEALPHVIYDDGSGRYEYVIFSDILRRAGIPQYIDNRELYGRISFATNNEQMSHDLNVESFSELVEYINKSIPKEWLVI